MVSDIYGCEISFDYLPQVVNIIDFIDISDLIDEFWNMRWTSNLDEINIRKFQNLSFNVSFNSNSGFCKFSPDFCISEIGNWKINQLWNVIFL